jgi:hypothetical protein
MCSASRVLEYMYHHDLFDFVRRCLAEVLDKGNESCR